MKQPPLTPRQLRGIQERNLIHADSMTLLREIKRLHGILHNCWQVFDSLPPSPHNTHLDLLIGLINNEPCVKAQRESCRQAGREPIVAERPNGILERVPGQYIAEAIKSLPPVDTAEDRLYHAEIDAAHAGRVRISYERKLAKHGRHAHWFWTPCRADPVC